jgi:hypothetical protein
MSTNLSANDTTLFHESKVTSSHHMVKWNDITGPLASRSSKIILQRRKGCYYLNPQVTLFCDKLTEAFFRRFHYFQDQWQTTIDNTLGLDNRHDLVRRAGPLGRELVYTGMLIIDGLRVDPSCWCGIEFNAVIETLIREMQSPRQMFTKVTTGFTAIRRYSP